MEIKKIAFGDEGQVATAELQARVPRLRELASAAGPGLAERADRTGRGIETLQSLDRQHGGSGPIALEGLAELVAAILTDLAHLESAGQRAPSPALLAENPQVP